MMIMNNDISKELVINLKESFKTTDNLRRSTQFENAIILEEKASLLIRASIGTNSFLSFMRTKPKEEYLSMKIYTLVEEDNILINNISFNEIVFDEKNPYDSFLEIKDYFVQSSFFLNNYYCHNQRLKHKTYYYPNNSIKIANKEFYKQSLFSYCKNISKRDTPEKVCKFFEQPSFPYAKIKINSKFYNTPFDISSLRYEEPTVIKQAKEINYNLSEETLVQNILHKFVIQNERDFILNKFFEKLYDNTFKQLYSFKDQNGDVVQKVIKLLDNEKSGKSFIPCSSWSRKNSYESEYYCLPYPKKQPLYNLDLIVDKNPEAVILTDSIEIADLNQKQNSYKIIWTSWLPYNVKELEFVDWEPLKNNGIKLYYLITNHSGVSIEESFIKAYQIYKYLKERENLQLQFIQVPVEYTENFNSVNNTANFLDSNIPAKILKEHIEILDEGLFLERYAMAEESLKSKPSFFWEASPEINNVEKDDKPTTKRVKSCIDYLVRPILNRGDYQYIHAKSGFGKSAFTLSLCASIISGKELFPERWWTVPKNTKYKYNKILYLDYEYDEKRYENRKIDFFNPYLPTSKHSQKLCIDNFIYEDTRGERFILSKEANHQNLIDLISKAKKSGETGQQIDLLVIDHLTKAFGGHETSISWEKVSPLLNKLNNAGITVLIIHHSTEDNKSAGFKIKDYDMSNIIKFTRNNSGVLTDINNPITIDLSKSRDSIVELDTKSFKFYYDLNQKKWTILEGENKNLSLLEIIKTYRKSGFLDEEIFKMLNMSNGAYYKNINTAIFELIEINGMDVKEVSELSGIKAKDVKNKYESYKKTLTNN